MTGHQRSPFLPSIQWTPAQLESDRRLAEDAFRQERMKESLEAYLGAFNDVQVATETLFAATLDLAALDQEVERVLRDSRLLEVFRYLAAPPVSLDDLRTIVNTSSFRPVALQKDPDVFRRVLETIHAGLDPRRFPWLAAGRQPTAVERAAAVLATASLIATRRVETRRRSEGKKGQEALVRETLTRHGLREVAVPGRSIPTLQQAPRPGEFCGEVTLGTRKADLVVGLWDHRIMAVECKVSNSATNSIKRLNNDAAVKAEVWRSDFGATQVIPVAVLGGVFKLRNLEDAQKRGLVLYWAHRLEDLVEWIAHTRQAK